MKKAILWTLVVGVLFGVLLLAKPDKSESGAGGGQLAVVQNDYNFGEISMKDGLVRHTFTVKNTSDKQATITKLYTSCMCTDATITAGTQLAGPYGMQGHGDNIPDVKINLQPGEKAQVEAVFDPAAHGSAGVGEVKRSVFVNSKSNPNLVLNFTATVRP